MDDIIKYLDDTVTLAKQYGTLTTGTSTLNVNSLIVAQFESEDSAFNEENFESDAFQMDTITDILNYFKESFVDNMKSKVIDFKDKFVNLIPNLKTNFLARLNDLKE